MSGQPFNRSLLAGDLERDEKFVSHVYQDSEGYWTIGIGRLVDARLKGGIARPEALYLLGNDIDVKAAELDKRIPWWRSLPEPQQRALLNMAFNMGVPNLMEFKHTLGLLSTGRFDAAATAALQSKWARQVGPRAGRVAELMRSR